MGARFFLWICCAVLTTEATTQTGNCTFKPPFVRLDFGTGSTSDFTQASLSHYSKVSTSCPSDGHYSYTSFTSDCFRGDWHTLETDHTPGDADGNMLLVNSAYEEGIFFTARVGGFKGGKTYQFGFFVMNVCRPTRKCPYPLLPNLTISLQAPGGKVVARFNTGEIGRVEYPHWTPHRARFTVPANVTDLVLVMQNNAPGGCGNDFAMDDITFQECVEPEAVKVDKPKAVPQTVKKVPAAVPKIVKKSPPPAVPASAASKPTVSRSVEKVTVEATPRAVSQKLTLVPPPPVLKQRTNHLVRQIRTEAGELRIDLYDNGQIDGDTVSVYHNNVLIVDRQALSRKPITFRITMSNGQPVHELIMVANNLGSIPPNTSLMTVTAKDKRYEVFISSTEQTNAKVVVMLNE